MLTCSGLVGALTMGLVAALSPGLVVLGLSGVCLSSCCELLRVWLLGSELVVGAWLLKSVLISSGLTVSWPRFASWLCFDGFGLYTGISRSGLAGTLDWGLTVGLLGVLAPGERSLKRV